VIGQKGNRKKTASLYKNKLKTIERTRFLKNTHCPAKCPYCAKIFNSIREWGLHIKEVHCR
jgi:hypothetical protein